MWCHSILNWNPPRDFVSTNSEVIRCLCFFNKRQAWVSEFFSNIKVRTQVYRHRSNLNLPSYCLGPASDIFIFYYYYPWLQSRIIDYIELVPKYKSPLKKILINRGCSRRRRLISLPRMYHWWTKPKFFLSRFHKAKFFDEVVNNFCENFAYFRKKIVVRFPALPRSSRPCGLIFSGLVMNRI